MTFSDCYEVVHPYQNVNGPEYTSFSLTENLNTVNECLAKCCLKEVR